VLVVQWDQLAGYEADIEWSETTGPGAVWHPIDQYDRVNELTWRWETVPSWLSAGYLRTSQRFTVPAAFAMFPADAFAL
jgi:hypothetical protein